MSDEDDNQLRFPGDGRRKPSTQARAYVYSVCAQMLENEFNHPDCIEGWMFGGITSELDRRRLTKEIKRLIAEMNRRAGKLRNG